MKDVSKTVKFYKALGFTFKKNKPARAIQDTFIVIRDPDGYKLVIFKRKVGWRHEFRMENLVK